MESISRIDVADDVSAIGLGLHGGNHTVLLDKEEKPSWANEIIAQLGFSNSNQVVQRLLL